MPSDALIAALESRTEVEALTTAAAFPDTSLTVTIWLNGLSGNQTANVLRTRTNAACWEPKNHHTAFYSVSNIL